MFAGASLDENSGAFCELKANFFRLILTKAELLALNKSDFDFRNNLLHITKTYNRIDKQDVITVPKTENSVRTINIPNFLKEKVQRYIDMHYGIPDDARLFPIVSRTLQKRMKRYAEKAGVKEIRVHDLRHPYVKPTTKKFITFFEVFRAAS